MRAPNPIQGPRPWHRALRRRLSPVQSFSSAFNTHHQIQVILQYQEAVQPLQGPSEHPHDAVLSLTATVASGHDERRAPHAPRAGGAGDQERFCIASAFDGGNWTVVRRRQHYSLSSQRSRHSPDLLFQLRQAVQKSGSDLIDSCCGFKTLARCGAPSCSAFSQIGRAHV